MKHIIAFLVVALSIFSINAEVLNVGTYNIRCIVKQDSLDGNAWSNRYNVIADIIKYQDFDVIGTQEGMYSQICDLSEALPSYSCLGVGTEDGKRKGGINSIFYRADKYDVLDNGTFWLSDITDIPNKGWDSAYMRNCTWALFRSKTTKCTFIVYNLHLDHIGKEARAKGLALVIDKIKNRKYKVPVILTGDFNMSQTDSLFSTVAQSGVVYDTYILSPVKLATTGTFNAWQTNTFTTDRIDHILVTSDIKVLRYGILNYTYRSRALALDGSTKYYERNPSDHYPVAVTMEIINKITK